MSGRSHTGHNQALKRKRISQLRNKRLRKAAKKARRAKRA